MFIHSFVRQRKPYAVVISILIGCPSNNVSGFKLAMTVYKMLATWVGATVPRRRLRAGLVRGQQTAPEICWYQEACRPENKNGTRCQRLRSLLRSRLEFSASRSPNFIVDCRNVCQTLTDILVWLLELAHLRTIYFALYKCARYNNNNIIIIRTIKTKRR